MPDPSIAQSTESLSKSIQQLKHYDIPDASGTANGRLDTSEIATMLVESGFTTKEELNAGYHAILHILHMIEHPDSLSDLAAYLPEDSRASIKHTIQEAFPNGADLPSLDVLYLAVQQCLAPKPQTKLTWWKRLFQHFNAEHKDA
jgi:hypothetical protein